MSVLHGLGGEAHVLEHFCVSVGVLQSFSLILDGGQSAVDLSQLLFITLLPLQGLEGSLRKQITTICTQESITHFLSLSRSLVYLHCILSTAFLLYLIFVYAPVCVVCSPCIMFHYKQFA